MKLGQIWDFVMRRKAQFLMLAAALFLGIAGLSRLIVKNQPSNNLNNLESLTSETYNNSLALKIAADGAKIPSYQLTFRDNYTKVTVRVTEEALQNEAYVRIFDPSGNLLRGEYTAIEDVEPVTPPVTEETDDPATTLPLEKPEEAVSGTKNQDQADEVETPTQGVTAVTYRFVNTPKSYELSLEPGSIIEVHSEDARFWSTLDNAEATAFRPEGTERYVVTAEGLSKENWGAAKTLAENYQLLKRFLVRQIEEYQAKVSEEILSDKNLDQAAKTKVVVAYNSLAEADQAEYAEFINWLINGKPPIEDEPGADDQPDDVTKEPGESEPQAGKDEPSETPVNPPIIIEEVPLPNDPATSVNSQYTVQTLGGRNDNEIVSNQDGDAQDTIVEEPATEEPKPTTPQVIRNDNAASQNNTVATEAEDDKTEEMPLWQKIALVALGIVVVLGLVRFIFDHYVR